MKVQFEIKFVDTIPYTSVTVNSEAEVLDIIAGLRDHSFRVYNINGVEMIKFYKW